MHFREIAMATVVLCLSGCGIVDNSSSYPLPNTAGGHFTVNQYTNSATITVSKKVDLAPYRKLLVVGLNNTLNNEDLNTGKYWENVLHKIGYFDNVISTDNLQEYLYDSTHDKSIPAVVDYQSLRYLEKHYGKFLLIEIHGAETNGIIVTTLVVKEPLTNDIFFKAEQKQAMNDMVPAYRVNALLNTYVDWLHQNMV